MIRRMPMNTGLIMAGRAFLFLLLGVGLLVSSASVVERLPYPFQVNQSEAPNVEIARLWAEGTLPYPDASRELALFSLYPPLFSVLAGGLMRLTGGLFLPGRLLAFAAFLGCAVLLFLWGRRRWGRDPAIWIAVLLLLSPTWRTWGSQVRPDTLCLFLHLAAFLLLLKMEEEKGGDRRALFAGLLAAGAVLVKQTAVLLPVVYALHALLRKDRRRLGWFMAGFLGILLPVTLALQSATDGRYLLYLTKWTSHGFDPALLRHGLAAWFAPEAGWLLVAAVWAIVTRRVPRLLVLQTGTALLWLSGLGRPGAAENYLMEFELYGLLLLGGALTGPARKGTGQGTLSRAGLVFLLAGSVLFLIRPGPLRPSAEEKAMKAGMLDFYSEEGDHLAVDTDLPLAAGHRILLPPAEYTILAERGDLSTEPLRRAVMEKRFKTVELYAIPRQYLLPGDVVREIQVHYRVKEERNGRLWLVPKEVP